MKVRLLCALFLAVTCATFGMPSDAALRAHPATETRVAEATAQGEACAAVMGADLGLPQTTITVAEEVTPPFTPPETFSSRGFTVEDVSFCRVAGLVESGGGLGDPVRGLAAGPRTIGTAASRASVRGGRPAPSATGSSPRLWPGGYAAVATDNGHTSTSGFDGSWSLGYPVRLVDFGYRAQHEATVAGKAVTRAYYGRDADFAYFVGCSQGGHHALMEAQRYP